MDSKYICYRVNIKDSLKCDCEDLSNVIKYKKIIDKTNNKYLLLLMDNEDELSVFSVNQSYKKIIVDDKSYYYNDESDTYFDINDLEMISLEELTKCVVGNQFNDIFYLYDILKKIKSNDEEYRANKNMILLKKGINFTE